ncbi:MAG TPA: formylglycine-generating enzyme family protein, partial [Nannocystaceae bacterium]|nr:formylglycine-generating enzyme family protein [Nannocystaceae bacterium]
MSAALRGHPLVGGCPPAWACSWGQDRRGVFAGFVVDGVEQRMRWIPPGRFTMGSPPDEPGRWEEEGPAHEVEITRGFWLGDTPVPQGLWEAVMGSNPSRFKDPRRPVEMVSWEECQAFCAALERLVPGLGVRLPSEAEWEYACRAGTKTATYAGAIEIRGERDAPVLDAIAWYGGNSGVDYELAEAEVSSGWPKKQYEHSRAGTRK